jgi:hypothetical protein
MPVRIAVQRSNWDVMHQKLVTQEFLAWLEAACPGTSVKAVSDEDICERALDWFDAVLFPGSIGSALCVEKFGETYRATVRDFVRRGGCYIGVCGGCYAAVSEFAIRSSAKVAAGGAFKYPGLLRNTISDLASFDKGIGKKTGRAAGPKMAGALMRGKLKTFDLIDAVAETPSFFGDPYFMKHRWAKLVLDGKLLRVQVRVAPETHPLLEGHEGERFASAYSGGPLLTSVGHGVTPLAYYDLTETLPEADGKIALAVAKHGDGLVIVSGPDFYIPFDTEPGVCIREGMVPSVPWLTERIIAGHVNCKRAG